MPAERRAAPASRYSSKYKYGEIILKRDASSTFPSGKRLGQAGVLSVLKYGKRLNRIDFELRFVISISENSSGNSKIAISVPKRLLKSSVARNRIKRLVREEFRGHCAATVPLHMLVSYKARNDARNVVMRRTLRRELASLFDDALLRTQTGGTGVRTG